MAGVDGSVGGDVQMGADLTDEAVLTEEVDALEDAVPVVAGNELGDASSLYRVAVAVTAFTVTPSAVVSGTLYTTFR